MINPARWLATKILMRRRRKQLKGLRLELSEWGIRTNHMSDVEVLEACNRFDMLRASTPETKRKSDAEKTVY